MRNLEAFDKSLQGLKRGIFQLFGKKNLSLCTAPVQSSPLTLVKLVTFNTACGALAMSNKSFKILLHH